MLVRGERGWNLIEDWFRLGFKGLGLRVQCFGRRIALPAASIRSASSDFTGNGSSYRKQVRLGLIRGFKTRRKQPISALRDPQP